MVELHDTQLGNGRGIQHIFRMNRKILPIIVEERQKNDRGEGCDLLQQ